MEHQLDESVAAELRELAEQLRQAEQIRDLTAVSVAESMARQLPTTTGMAVHPESIRQAAETIVKEEKARDTAEAALHALGERPEPEPRRGQPAGPTQADRQLRPWPLALIALLLFGLGAIAAVALGAPVAVPIALGAAGILLAVVLTVVRRRRARRGRNSEPVEEATESDVDHEAEWLAQRSKLEVDRDRAVERLRSARRQWETLAGPNANPHNIDAVLRLHDPQYRLHGLADDTSPTVRTANALHRRVLARWRVKWAALGYDEPPAPDEVEEALTRLRE